MEKKMFICWFEELCKDDAPVVGKKCANLGEMTRLGMNVPPGFSLTLALYEKFLQDSGLGERLGRYIGNLEDLKGAGVERLRGVSSELRGMIENEPMPKEIANLIWEHYDELCKRVGIPNTSVSVRSAGVASRPGMFETYLNIEGKEEVVDHVQKVWASAFTPRAIAFRISKGLAIDYDMLGVAVVKMVNARAAGIGFTIDPVLGDDSKVIIEANWGLGEGVVSGVENVDRWTVDKQTLKIVESSVGKKMKCVINMEKSADWAEVPSDKQDKPCLSDEEIKAVAEVAIHLEQKLGQPQDMEWAVDPDFPAGKNVFLLQTRLAKSVAKKAVSESKDLADKLASNLRSSVDVSKTAEKIKKVVFKF
ncbi:MAG: PEP/pyruvate-binding domain-containing protein [Proteobacteria bacterium]|nr:PEP/pyruvate-binding domain-containing protein [Pseudomonadota bacterium]